ncbi:Short-chain dehydrogenase [Psilocybe cubensis]|uniref:Short-chain dehydrogenase n=1 Tax=Psilocybe cubensis TaxID=181762 RepID=A0ACB8GVU8_PSICU|nr:Short-chain dehydrogenase [Psilocybe cubensis]KAH9479105.1 Short-chain dehydrogenase [Psilocybe cubensis]
MFQIFPSLVRLSASIRPCLYRSGRYNVPQFATVASYESTGHAGSVSPVAVVTGASRGIGRAIALQLARDGYDVALNDLPSNKIQLEGLSSEINEQTGQRTLVLPGDVSVEDDVKGLVEASTKDLGGVDVMIANAGVALLEPLLESNIDNWDRVVAVNLRGVFLCYKYAAQQMVKQGRGGRIIGRPFCGAYSATKFAVRSLTQTTAQELAQHGITVNAYAPGPIETDMISGIPMIPDEAIRHTIERLSDSEYTIRLQNLTKTDLGYVGSPQDVAGLVSFLVSDKGRFITGQAITIDGGMIYQ